MKRRDPLKEALAAIGVPRQLVQRTTDRHPAIAQAMRSLLDYLTPDYPGQAAPLAQECFRAAFDAMTKTPETQWEATFMLRLCETAAKRILCCRVGVVEHGVERYWTPFMQSFAAFNAQGRELIVLEEAVTWMPDVKLATFALAVRILPANQLSDLFALCFGAPVCEAAEAVA